MASTRRTGKARPNGKGRVAKKDLSRDEILEVAAVIFREKGYRATNLQEVADHFGVKRPAIYYYFSSKAEILGEINDRFLEELVRELEEIEASDLSADEKLIRVITGQVSLFAENIAELAVFLGNETELTSTVRRRAQVRKREYQKKLEGIFREGVAEGAFRDLDPQITISTLIGMTNWMYRWYRSDGPTSPAQIAETIVEFARGGYLAEG